MAESNDKKRHKIDPHVGVKFTAENQPSPEAKKAGWQELRAQKLLTQKILEEMTKGTNMNDYFQSLLNNAKEGNAKAIDTINNGIEEQKIVTENKHTIDVETVTFK